MVSMELIQFHVLQFLEQPLFQNIRRLMHKRSQTRSMVLLTEVNWQAEAVTEAM
jgi:hypothetical protein